MNNKKNNLSRRDFFKYSALASTAFVVSTPLVSCTNERTLTDVRDVKFPFFNRKEELSEDQTAGLLFSQVGYEPGYPIRIILRLPGRNHLASNAVCKLLPVTGQQPHEAPLKYWGEVWGSHWWEARFDGIEETGLWDVEVTDDSKMIYQDKGLKIEKDVLWNSTIDLSSADILERRVHFTGVGAGWQDAGTLWVESCAQSAMIIGLEETIEKGSDRLDEDLKERIYKQITVGCDYLVMTQEKAGELGYPEGAMSHDMLDHTKVILPNDANKAIVALWKAVRLLPDSYSEKKKQYDRAANKTYKWLRNKAKPMGDFGFSYFQRGLDENVKIPEDEWQTRDLMMLCYGALEKYKNGDKSAEGVCVELADKVYQRQIEKNNPESGYYGHFREYDSLPHTEKAWCHGIVNNNFGADLGGFFPNYIMPVIEMLKMWPDHRESGKWENVLKNFAYGYLIPVCEKNPFKIIPLGIFGEEGPIWFCGTFHGTNAIYGFTAALALELSEIFNEPRLKEIAYGNMQWLAGLNAGLTRKNMEQGCVVFSTDVPDKLALPSSMICHIGHRWAGTWFQTRGVICNGFSTGQQFVYDVKPLKKNDGPFSLTDEDWIPHSAAWLTGLVRL